MTAQSTPLKMATIGRGFIVDRAVDAICDVPEIELEAVYSRSKKDGQDFAGKHGVAKSYDDLDLMLVDDQVDVVYIASPNTLHFQQAKKALEAGKHVIVEKPFTTNQVQAKELFELAQKKGLMIFEAMTTLHTDNFKELQKSLTKAGPIRAGVLNFSQYDPRYDLYLQKQVSNVFDPAYDGGALMDVNVYNIQFALRLFGKPQSIEYFPNLGWNGIDTSGTLIMSYPGFTIMAVAAKDHSAPWHSYLAGENGTFIIDEGSLGRMNHVVFSDTKGNTETLSKPHRNHMSAEFSDFARMILNRDKKAYEDFRDQTLMSAEILDEAKRQRDFLSMSLEI